MAEGRFEDEGWRVRKDSTRFWANVVITALRDPSGKPARFFQTHPRRDRKKKAEENAQRLLQRIGGSSSRGRIRPGDREADGATAGDAEKYRRCRHHDHDAEGLITMRQCGCRSG